MPVSELILPAALIVYFLAAAHDVAARTIPDRCSLALIVLAVSRFVLAGDGTAAMMATAAAVAVFIGLAALCLTGILGGGDVKLLTASALLVGAPATPALLTVTALIGGLVAAIYLAASLLLCRLVAPRRLPPTTAAVRRLRVMLAAELRRIRRRYSIPYGLAIAGAAAVTLAGLS